MSERTLTSQRDLFEIPSYVTYLNCAYMGPLLKSALDAGRTAIDLRQHPWRMTPDHFFDSSESVRRLGARLLGTSADQIAIVSSASYGLATAAQNLPLESGDEIVILAEQFPSNVYTWHRHAADYAATVVTVARPDDDDWTPAILNAIGPRTRIAALPHCHWTDGDLIDLEAVSDQCRANSCALVLDVTQSLGALPLDVTRIRPAFLTAAAYKWLLGPYSYGFLYVDEAYLDGTPLEENWINREGARDFAQLVNYQDRYAPGARRFDFGERASLQLTPIAEVALLQILDWGVENIAQSLGVLTAEIAGRAEEIGFGVNREDRRAPHMLGLRWPTHLPENLGELLKRENVSVSIRGDAIRVSPHLYNDTHDIDHLFEVLAPAVRTAS